jgi:hypothetical protein
LETAKTNKTLGYIFNRNLIACLICETVFRHTKKSRTTLPDKVTRLFKSSWQPGYLLEIRGFPSPSYDGFGFIVELFYKYAYFICIGILKINFRKIFTTIKV